MIQVPGKKRPHYKLGQHTYNGKGLLDRLYGGAVPKGMRPCRYFKMPKGGLRPEHPGVLDLFSDGQVMDNSLTIPLTPAPKISEHIVLAPDVPVSKPKAHPRGMVLELFTAKPAERKVQTDPKARDYGHIPGGGIDLALRGHEVRKILYKCFGGKLRAGGYDPEEVLAEVYKGLLIRNEGKCPWDPTKSSFGHYVYMVCNGVLGNYHQKVQRRRRVIQTGLRSFNEDHPTGTVDVGSANSMAVADKKTDRAMVRSVLTELVAFVAGILNYGQPFIRKVLTLLAHGHKRSAVCRVLECSVSKVNRVWNTAKAYFEEDRIRLADPNGHAAPTVAVHVP